MLIGGLQKVTLIDFPGRIAATVFLCGCDFRCPWCYARELVVPKEIKKQSEISEKDFFEYLRERKGLVEGVTICGGEPCLDEDLLGFCQKIKKLGYLVKLDTNGSNPKMLKDLIEKKLVDYMAMDIKNDLIFEKYKKTVGDALSKRTFEKVKKSINILMEGKIDYEFRTTLVKEFHQKEDIIKICKKIKGARIYYLQNFKEGEKTLSGKKYHSFSEEEIGKIIKEGKRYVKVKSRLYF